MQWNRWLMSGSLALCCGCGVSMMDIRPLAVTIPSDPTALERLETVARARGYAVLDADGARGTFVVEAQARARPTETVRFTVQCYRNGFAEVTPSGPRVALQRDRFHLPSGVGAERGGSDPELIALAA